MTEKMGNALSEQITREFESALLYKSMAATSADLGLAGATNWFNLQAEEEMLHGKKFFDYLLERGIKPGLTGVAAPKTDWVNIQEMLEDTLAHEKKVTNFIGDLVQIARDERDFGTEIFLQWFVTEQVEEESTVQGLLDKLKLLGSQETGLYLFDAELGKRVATSAE